MRPPSLAYAVVTPARNEERNLKRLQMSLAAQTALPRRWVIVDNGSTDSTLDLAEACAADHEWISVTAARGEPSAARGGPVARAFLSGCDVLEPLPDILVKLDADVSLEPDYFERLIERFAANPRLGIAGGTCYEHQRDAWRPIFTSRSHVRGAVRAYRRECFLDVLPLEERMGWDTIDEVKARINGWTTATFADLPFYHHRQVGERDGIRQGWRTQGDLAHYLQYRLPYLLLRTLYRSVQDPAAAALLLGYLGASLQRRARYGDRSVVAFLREEQRLRYILLRSREVRGRA